MSAPTQHTRPSIAPTLFLVAGVFFTGCLLVYNEYLVIPFARRFTIAPEPSAVRAMQMAYLVLAAVFIAAGSLIQRFPRGARWLGRPAAEKTLLAVMAFLVPIATLEIALRPFAHTLSKQTTLFERDDDLGWRMRPGAEQPWGDVTVRINGKGLRGPELSYEKPDGVYRVLYMGDSVTFGYGLERAEHAFPYRTSMLIERVAGRRVETINAGVGGYSPWQERIYLEREGLSYSPDLVVVAFVLNDVTEKFHLTRFGGEEDGYQLTESYYSWVDKFLTRSAIVYQVRNITRKYKARRRLGGDLRLGAVQQEALDVKTLWENPGGENVRVAWEITLGNVGSIFEKCREEGVEAVLAVFPFRAQLEAPGERGVPQRVIVDFAAANGIPAVNLMDAMLAEMERTNESPDDYFIDPSHLSVRGNDVVAAALAAFIEEGPSL